MDNNPEKKKSKKLTKVKKEWIIPAGLAYKK